MLSKNIKYIHYIGEHAVVGLHNNETYLLNSIQKEIVKEFLLHHDSEDVVEHFIKKNEIVDADIPQARILISNYFNKLKNMGILASKEDEVIYNINTTGIEGQFYPYRITFELTNACVAYCSHCFKKANDGPIKYIDYSKMYEFCTNGIHNEFQIVHLTGGEPLLHPQFQRIMQLFSDKDIELNTNGILINNYSPDIFKKVKALSIGIYGLSDREYLQNTGISNGYSALKESCEMLVKNNIVFSISLVINKKNIDFLEKYVETAYRLGASEFIPGLANQIGRLEYVCENNQHWLLSPEEKRFAYRKLRELGKKYYGKILIDDWGRDQYRSNDKLRETEKVYKNRCFQCGAGTLKWTITEDFMFKPCTMFLDCPQLLFSESEWKQYTENKNEIIWSDYLQAFISNCKKRGTIPSEYCDYIPKDR